MRFEIHETVQTPDPEVVLRALEMCSREISSDVVRSGDRITLRGVGPSPRSKNKHDTTVFCVNAEDDKTLIQGEVNFQASALLGDTSQQEVVRSKLDDLFEQMRAQIHLDSMRVAAYAAARRSAASSATSETASTTVADQLHNLSVSESQKSDLSEESPWASEEQAASAVTPVTLIEAVTAAPDSAWNAVALRGEPQELAVPGQEAELHRPHLVESSADVPLEPNLASVQAEPVIHAAPEVQAEPKRAIYSALPTELISESSRPTEPKQTPAKADAARPKPGAGSGIEQELTWKARTPLSRLRAEEAQPSGWKRIALWTTIAAILLVLAAGAYRLYWLRRDLSAYPASSAAKGVPAQAIDSPTASAPLSPLPQTSLGNTSAKPNTTAEAAVSNAELRRWLQGWATSMQTRDANAQASFYADRLDRYLDQRNVGRAAVLRDREATNRMRKGLWTVKMEDIVIERQTASEAEIRLRKHFIDEPEKSEILESYVPSHLIVKRIDGQWKITSEQDQPTISVSPWKAQGRMRQDQDTPVVRESPTGNRHTAG